MANEKSKLPSFLETNPGGPYAPDPVPTPDKSNWGETPEQQRERHIRETEEGLKEGTP